MMDKEAESRPGADIVWDPSVPPLSRAGDYAVGRAGSRPQPQLPACHRQEISWQKAGAGTEGSWRLTGGGTQRKERGRGRGVDSKDGSDSGPLTREGARGGGSQASPDKAEGRFSGGGHRGQDPGS